MSSTSLFNTIFGIKNGKCPAFLKWIEGSEVSEKSVFKFRIFIVLSFLSGIRRLTLLSLSQIWSFATSALMATMREVALLKVKECQKMRIQSVGKGLHLPWPRTSPAPQLGTLWPHDLGELLWLVSLQKPSPPTLMVNLGFRCLTCLAPLMKVVHALTVFRNET